MASDVLMPRLSDGMEEGTVLKWLVEPGGEVKQGEAIAEIETDKANMTYEADVDGTLLEIVVGEGDSAPIGEVIARVGDPSEAGGDGGGGESAGGEASGDGEGAENEGSGDDESAGDGGAGGDGPDGADEAAEEQPAEPERGVATSEEDGGSNGAAAAPSGGGGGQSDGNGRIKASPVARRIAGERGVELTALEGSGPGGRIVKADVLAAAENGDGAGGTGTAEGADRQGDEAEGESEDQAPSPDTPEEQVEPGEAQPAEPTPAGQAGPKGEVRVQELTRLQQTVARRMAESKATAPEFELTTEVDMGACVELRGRLKEIADPVPSYNDMIVKACAIALKEFPRANGAYRDGKFELYEKVNVGIAVAALDTLIVPTLFDAGRKSLGEIARDARAIIQKVRDNKVTPPELSGGTFTVSNLGMFGISHFTAVINPPQAAILAVGALTKKAVVDDGGRIVARDRMSLTLVCDHRILYGADGAEFLSRVRALLEQPLALAL